MTMNALPKLSIITPSFNQGVYIEQTIRSTGDIVGWINSDDYYEENIFESVMECFQDPDVMWVIGNLTHVFEQTKEMVPDRSPHVTFDRLVRNPDIIRQQPTFFPDYFMAVDFDLWTRLTRLSSPRMMKRNWAYFRLHTLQKTSHANVLRQKEEIVAILRREGVQGTSIERFVYGID